MKDQLYLLRPGFMNAGMGPLYCSDSAPVEGVLSFFPQLRDLIACRAHELEIFRHGGCCCISVKLVPLIIAVVDHEDKFIVPVFDPPALTLVVANPATSVRLS